MLFVSLFTVDWLSGHMKGRYCNMKLKKYKEEKDPWPPIKTKSYVTLAIVHQKELQTRQETKTTIYLRTKGDIHKIPHTIGTEKLTDITQIFDPVSGTVPNNILIEGHAGIGKTTLVKQICIQWAEDKLLTSDKLVLLLLLRDPNVQKITSERKLIEHFTKSTSKVEQLYSYLEDKHGADVTLIIDGFDELSPELRHESFFRELIEKRCLPKARIVVTSRPSASACLHVVVDKRTEILGFEQSSKNQYVTEALQDYPSKLEKLQRHFQQYPNIDAICYIPLIMSIIVFLCMCQPDELPPTATKMYANFILHTICHYLKRVGKIPKDLIINKLEQFPPVVCIALQDLQKTAFDGLVKDKIVFTVEELPVLCKDDPTCYGLLQSTECYSAEEIGTPTQSFNFLHLGIQEYFAAKYVTTLPEDEVYTLLKESFIVTDHKNVHNPAAYSNNVRLSNMWILYCGITSGQCKTLRHYITTYSNLDPSDKILAPTMSLQPLSINPLISQDVLKDPVKVLYLFQCFQEAQDNELCEILSRSFDSGVINISKHRLLPHQVVSLGFFLSRSHMKWNELNLFNCCIGDHGMNIIHQYLCGDKASKQKTAVINLGGNGLTGASSHLIADIISHLQPHTLILNESNITNVRDISTAVINTSTVKVLDMWSNDLTAQEAVAISDMMICLEELNISSNKLGDHEAELLSEGITNTKTLRVLDISDNNIGPSGTTAIANALTNNTSLEKLDIRDNKLGDHGAELLSEGITNTKTLRALNISYNNIGPLGTTGIANALTSNTSLKKLNISGNNIGPSGTTAIANALTSNTSLKKLNISDNNIGPSGTTAIVNAVTSNTSLKKLNISHNKLDDHGVELLSQVITNTKTLRALNISYNNIGPSGTTAIVNALTNNTSLEKLYMDGNAIGQDGVIALSNAITNNRMIKKLLLAHNVGIDKESAMIIIKSLYNNNTITKLSLPITLYQRSDATLLTEEAEKLNSMRKLSNDHIIDFTLHFAYPQQDNAIIVEPRCIS